MLTYMQAIIIGALQGVTELFPVSSLGHSVLVPTLVGWSSLAQSQSSPESFYLAFIVGLHVATALALVVYFWRDWVRIVKGLLHSLRTRKVDTPDARLGWLLVIGTIPVGVVGLVFEHSLRVLFAKPLAAAVFLMLNGLLLLGGEKLRRRAERRRPAMVAAAGTGPSIAKGADDGVGNPDTDPAAALASDRRLSRLGFPDGALIGSAQILALFAGISRSGATMVAGLLKGLNHEDAARFSFLLATPVILAAGVYKVPDLLGPLGNAIRGEILAGSIAAGVAAYLSVRFLVRWFTTRTLTPFGIYCLAAGAALTLWLLLR